MDDDRSGRGIKYYITKLGGRIEKTFNRKVTHVVFRDGYTKTYDTAMERKIPLVSARWVEASKNVNKLLDPVDFPPINMEKYTAPREYKFKFNFKRARSPGSIFIPGEKARDELFIAECAEFLKKYQSTPTKNLCEENEKDTTTVKTPPKKRKYTKRKVNTTIPEPSEEKNTIVQTETETEHTNQRIVSSMTKSPMPTGIINVLGSHLVEVLNSDRALPDMTDVLFPMPIKLLRKILTPNLDDVRPPDVINSELVEIENHLKLTSANRQKLRKLLFPSSYSELQDMSFFSNMPPQ